MKPYIGITGFKTREEVEAINELSSQANIMFGFLSSKKRLEKPQFPGTRSPAAYELSNLVEATKGWPVIHYFSETREGLAEEAGQVLTMSGCNAVQLNQDWPLEKEVEKLHSEGIEVILQIPKRAQKSIRETAERVQNYKGIVDYILIDPSGGLGIPFDLGYAVANMHALREPMPEAGIGIAGGLCADTVYDRVQGLSSLFPYDFSIDAETLLRTPNQKALDLKKSRKFVKKANQGFDSKVC